MPRYLYGCKASVLGVNIGPMLGLLIQPRIVSTHQRVRLVQPRRRPNATPDCRLHNEICDIALCAHKAMQLAARYAKKAAFAKLSACYERPLRAQKI